MPEVQGLGHIVGEGLELMVTFGTGVGSAVFVDGKLVPGLELGQRCAANGKTYDLLLNRAAFDEIGRVHWRKRVCRMMHEIDAVWNYRKLPRWRKRPLFEAKGTSRQYSRRIECGRAVGWPRTLGQPRRRWPGPLRADACV